MSKRPERGLRRVSDGSGLCRAATVAAYGRLEASVLDLGHVPAKSNPESLAALATNS
jgi:hypothetical protein